MNTTVIERDNVLPLSSRQRRKWPVFVIVVIVVLVAEIVRSRYVAIKVVQASLAGIELPVNSPAEIDRVIEWQRTMDLSATMHVFCKHYRSVRGLPHWHVEFEYPIGLIRGKTTTFVLWSETWNKASAIEKQKWRFKNM